MKKFTNTIIASFFLVATVLAAAGVEASCFSPPVTLKSDEIQEVRSGGQLDMAWSFGEAGESHFRFVTESDEVYLELLLVGRAESMISEETRAFLRSEVSETGESFSYFTFLLSNSDEQSLYVPLRSKIHDSPESSSYLVHERRVLSEEPVQVDLGFLTQCLLGGRVAIYTGAGISAASGVPTMGQLNDLLGFEESEEFLLALEKIVWNPVKTAKNIRLFHNACFASDCTAAHRAIADLSVRNGTPVMTENLDCLHEVSGIRPYRVNADEIREEVSKEEACSIDWIICIGLSYDDRGFLGWYKEMNPNGRILSVDIGTPSYLGAEDCILKADLQQALSEIAAEEVLK